MTTKRKLSLPPPDKINQILNKTERTNPTAHSFAEQNSHDQEGSKRKPRKHTVIKQKLNSRESIANGVRLQTPSPQNRKQQRQRYDVENYDAEEQERQKLHDPPWSIEFQQVVLDLLCVQR
jgi:hypothetical protein